MPRKKNQHDETGATDDAEMKVIEGVEAQPEPTAELVNITWLGEDDQHENGNGPNLTVWRGIKFPKGQAVAVSHPVMIEKAKANRFFAVEGHDKG